MEKYTTLTESINYLYNAHMHSVLLFIALLALPFPALANTINAGFVSGFWYSEAPVFAGDTVRVYVAIRNNTEADLTGTVIFYANDKRLGSQSVSALDGRIIESWIDWTPSYGNYELRAELNRVTLSAAGEASEPVASALAAATDSLFIDYDTDGDGIGNEDDTDDDGDGVTDADEVAAGTDPLTADTATESTPDTTEATSAVSATEAVNTPTTTAAGLERYLTPSRADTLLTNVTNWTEATKQQLDAYRETRQANQIRAEAPEVIVNSDGFGEVVRSTDERSTTAAPQNEGNGIIAGAINFVGNILSFFFSLLLATLSWFLSYAILMQLLLLFGILSGTYYLARKFGGRPSGKRT